MPTKSFPGFDRIFELSDPLSDRPLRGEFSEAKALEVTRAEMLVEKPISVKWAMGGSKPSDLIWTTSAHPVLIHERVQRLLLDGAFTGWSTYPVAVTGKRAEQYEGYHGLSITGRCGSVDLAPSEIALREYPAGWFPYLVGYFFETGTWDGSDLFMHQPDEQGRESAQIFITEIVWLAMRQAGIQNVCFRRLSELSVSASVYEKTQSDKLPPDFGDRVKRAYEMAGVPRPRSD